LSVWQTELEEPKVGRADGAFEEAAFPGELAVGVVGFTSFQGDLCLETQFFEFVFFVIGSDFKEEPTLEPALVCNDPAWTRLQPAGGAGG
tara:strand:+ start:571 stop:840 length:270 start_codon:yes stop_codon:yes gene_type:complete